METPKEMLLKELKGIVDTLEKQDKTIFKEILRFEEIEDIKKAVKILEGVVNGDA